MILSGNWKKKAQAYEHQIHRKRLVYEIKRLDHLLLELCQGFEEDKSAVHEHSLEIHNCQEESMSEVCESKPIFDSYEDGEVYLGLSQCEHEPEGPDSEKELFNDHSNPTDTHCGEATFELIGEPMFDTYEHEYGHVNLLSECTSNLPSESREMYQHSNILGPLIQESATKLIENSCSLIWETNSGFLHQNMHGMSLISPVAPQYELYGVKTFVEEAYFKPGVCNGPGLLDYYIEDDEIKDVKSLSFLQSQPLDKVQKVLDLRSNPQQPGVNDAGASSCSKG